jgi:succinyl-diaminopimelate desuccinylase
VQATEPTKASELPQRADRLDTVKLLQQLVSMESCDPPGREIDIAKFLCAELAACGIEAELDEFLPGRANVLGVVKGTGRKKALVLSAHLDTVPPGSVDWSFPPFCAEIRQARVLGRGTSDMKSAIAAMVAAAVKLSRRADPLQGDVLLAFSAGESSNCMGAKRFVERGLRERMGALLVGEPSSLDVIVAEKAVAWLRVAARGKIGHVSGDPGTNAIDAMVDFLKEVQRVDLQCAPHPFLDGPTIRVGRIGGGSAVNITPDACVAEIDVRLPSTIAPEDILRRFRDIAPAGITIEMDDYKPLIASRPEDPFVRICANTCARALGREPAILGVSYYSDAAILAAGMDVPFAIVGPGELGMSGQRDEYVLVESVHGAASIYEAIAVEWLG